MTSLIDFEAVVYSGVQAGKPTDEQNNWLRLFDSLFSEDAEDMENYQAYYDGDQTITWSLQKFVDIFGVTFKTFRDNWVGVVIDACSERLVVTGFTAARLEDESADPEEENEPREGEEPQEEGGGVYPEDPMKVPLPQETYNKEMPKPPKDDKLEKLRRKASAIWQRNRLDAVQEQVHCQALVKGKSYLMCWPNPETMLAEIFFHDAALIRCWYDIETNQLEVAAKQWRRPDGSVRRNLYFADRVEKWILQAGRALMTTATEAQKTTAGVTPGRNGKGSTPLSLQQWERFADEGDAGWPVENPYDRVPVIPFYNKPLNSGQGVSEIKNVIPQQDAINHEVANLMVGSEYAAFKQKIIASKGRPKDGWKHGPNQLWSTTDTDAKWGQFEETPLANWIAAIEMFVQHVASTTRTPHHYFFTTGDAPSGESLRASEAGLIKKVESKQVHFGNSWEDAIRFALEIELGANALPDDLTMSAIWKSPETRIEKDFWETLGLKSKLGIPNEVLWEEAGYSPEQVEEMKGIQDAKQSMEIGDALLAGFDGGRGGGAQDAMNLPGRPPPPGGKPPPVLPARKY